MKMVMTAAMTGLRQGELLALRWGDVDWRAGRLRVRRTFTRGSFGAPKSRRSSRSSVSCRSSRSCGSPRAGRSHERFDSQSQRCDAWL